MKIDGEIVSPGLSIKIFVDGSSFSEAKTFFIEYHFKGPYQLEYQIKGNRILDFNEYGKFIKYEERFIFSEQDKKYPDDNIGFTYVSAKLEVFKKLNNNFRFTHIILRYALVNYSIFHFYSNLTLHQCKSGIKKNCYFQSQAYQRNIKDSIKLKKKIINIPKDCGCENVVQLQTIDETSISFKFQTNQFYNFESHQIIETFNGFNDWFFSNSEHLTHPVVKLFRDSLTKGRIFYDGLFIRTVAEEIKNLQPFYNHTFSELLKQFTQLSLNLDQNCVVVNHLLPGSNLNPYPVQGG